MSKACLQSSVCVRDNNLTLSFYYWLMLTLNLNGKEPPADQKGLWIDTKHVFSFSSSHLFVKEVDKLESVSMHFQ